MRLRSKGPGKEKDEYINANYIDGFRTPRAYIGTQGPTPATFSTFWKMVWEQNTYVIAMITHIFENGKVGIFNGRFLTLQIIGSISFSEQM